VKNKSRVKTFLRTALFYFASNYVLSNMQFYLFFF